jgi:hypothetical protein
MFSNPNTLAPEYNTSIALNAFLKFSVSGGLNVSVFSKDFSKPEAVSLIFQT